MTQGVSLQVHLTDFANCAPAARIPDMRITSAKPFTVVSKYEIIRFLVGLFNSWYGRSGTGKISTEGHALFGKSAAELQAAMTGRSRII